MSFLLQDQMAKLPPLFVPKKPTGLTSKTGLVKIGELPDDVPGKTELNNLTIRATQLMNVSLFTNELAWARGKWLTSFSYIQQIN